MSRNIVVESWEHTPIERQTTEIVERKGIGHPDSIADGLAESVSRALSTMYRQRYNRILHHNTDEVQVVGGQSAPHFGGGVVLEPAYVLLVGRAVTQVNGERLPYRTTAVAAAHDYLARVCTNLNVDADVVIDCKIGQGSVDLRGLYETQKQLANDTSFGVCAAPYSETELLALRTEEMINGPLKKDLPEVGHDVKVMAVRTGDKIRLTVAAAIVDKFVPDKDHYVNVIQELRERVLDNAAKLTKRDVSVDVNTGDNYYEGIVYLTVTGLSFENGDDGSVGRGNRVNGLITPYRPMSLEAAAGKNPVTHVGKLYNLLAFELSHQITDECKGDVEEVWIRIVSQIGKPIDEPQVAVAQLSLAKGVKIGGVKGTVDGIIDSGLENIHKLTDKVVAGKVRVF
ncbi:MAG: methionine adenosyltransferase [Methanobacteriota archaeon]|nr:MAG: methionine adenosyltransferase [Euryarchaeota archaeon]